MLGPKQREIMCVHVAFETLKFRFGLGRGRQGVENGGKEWLVAATPVVGVSAFDFGWGKKIVCSVVVSGGLFLWCDFGAEVVDCSCC